MRMLDFNISILNIGRPNLQCLTVDKLSTYLLSKYPLNKLIYLSLSGLWRGCFVYNEALRLSVSTLITLLVTTTPDCLYLIIILNSRRWSGANLTNPRAINKLLKLHPIFKNYPQKLIFEKMFAQQTKRSYLCRLFSILIFKENKN